MLLYRITQKQFANLDGVGGLLANSRWNEKGHRVVYLSENRSLAVLEFLVHVTDFALAPDDMVILTIEAAESYTTLDNKSLPTGWENKALITRKIGTDFLAQNEFLLMRVPSVIVPTEHNYLLNPVHSLSRECKITNSEPFNFDQRILGLRFKK